MKHFTKVASIFITVVSNVLLFLKSDTKYWRFKNS